MSAQPTPAIGHMPFKGHRTQDNVCRDCDATISRFSTGRCRKCALIHRRATDPNFEQQRLAGLRRKFATDPDYCARMAIVRRDNGQRPVRWCPRHYRAEYHRLRLTKRMLARDARALIEQQIAKDTRGLDPLARAIKLAELRP